MSNRSQGLEGFLDWFLFKVPFILIGGLFLVFLITWPFRAHKEKIKQQREAAEFKVKRAADEAAYQAELKAPKKQVDSTSREIDSSSRGFDWRSASPEAKDRYLKSHYTSLAEQKFSRSGLDELYGNADFEIGKIKLEDAREIIGRRGR